MNFELDYRQSEKRSTVEFFEGMIDFDNSWFVTIRPTIVRSNHVGQSELFRKFQSKLNKKVFNHQFLGLDKARKQEGSYLKMIPVMEKNTTDDGVHWHVIIEDPSRQSSRKEALNFKEATRGQIMSPYSNFVHPKKMDKSDVEWFKPVDFETKKKLSNYAVKGLEKGQSPVCWENLYI